MGALTGRRWSVIGEIKISAVHTIKLVWNYEETWRMFLNKQKEKGEEICLETNKCKLLSTRNMLTKTDVNFSKWI